MESDCSDIRLLMVDYDFGRCNDLHAKANYVNLHIWRDQFDGWHPDPNPGLRNIHEAGDGASRYSICRSSSDEGQGEP